MIIKGSNGTLILLFFLLAAKDSCMSENNKGSFHGDNGQNSDLQQLNDGDSRTYLRHSFCPSLTTPSNTDSALTISSTPASIMTAASETIVDAADVGLLEEEKQTVDSPSAARGTSIGKTHSSFVLMYNMLTGIRHSVSVCQAKMSRPLTPEDFVYTRTYNFLHNVNSMAPSKYEFRFKDYCPWVFRALRETFGIDAADYLVSLTGKYALSELSSPGKSGSFFYYSQDFGFIIKTIRQSEHEFLRKILRSYYDHVCRNPDTLLTRFYGLHRVRVSNIRNIYFVVMGNLFPAHLDIHESFDLKGSTLGRLVPPEEITNNKLITKKDLNWIHQNKQLRLSPTKADALMSQLEKDCSFLSYLQIMDYSLLVGIHDLSKGNREQLRKRSMRLMEASPSDGKAVFHSHPIASMAPIHRKGRLFYDEEGGMKSDLSCNNESQVVYFIGIIDILTSFSILKRFENAFLSVRHNRRSISAINPKDYAKRFLTFIRQSICSKLPEDSNPE